MNQAMVNGSSRLEDELLICCARVTQSADVQERLEELLRQPIDWQKVLQRSWWHRIRPLTYLHLSRQKPRAVPAAFLKVLGDHVTELEQRNAKLLGVQQRVAELFEESSVPMLVFKGPTLAIDAYRDLKLRECGDLDMLVRREDFDRVREFLTADGFHCLWDDVVSERKRQVFACEFRGDGVELDIHWDLAPDWHNYNVNFDHLWESGHAFNSNCRYSRKLRAEDSVEILCMHGTRHWWERLRWICDIAELVNSGLITDWQRVETTATEGRCHRSVCLGLWLAVELLDANLPPDVNDQLNRLPVVKRLADQVGMWLVNAEKAAAVRGFSQRFKFRIGTCDRPRDLIPQIARYLLALPSRSMN